MRIQCETGEVEKHKLTVFGQQVVGSTDDELGDKSA